MNFILRIADHCGIFLLIAGYVAIASAKDYTWKIRSPVFFVFVFVFWSFAESTAAVILHVRCPY